MGVSPIRNLPFDREKPNFLHQTQAAIHFMSSVPEIPLHIDLLIDKLLQKRLSPEEFDILADWRVSKPENDQFVNTLVYLCEPSELDPEAKRMMNKAYNDFLKRTARLKNRKINPRM